MWWVEGSGMREDLVFSYLQDTQLPDNESVEHFPLPYSVGRPVPELHPSQQVTVLHELNTRVSARPVPVSNGPVWE